jgi:hypothetical protein
MAKIAEPVSTMPSCSHDQLELLPEKKQRVRCRHCHLTISEQELGDGFCPECYEKSGDKRYDFEPLPVDHDGPARYRCEQCGIIIDTD